MGYAEAMQQKRQLDEVRQQTRDEVAKEFVADIARLTAEIGDRDAMIREGHDLLNAVMLRSGLIFKLQEHAEVIAKVKAWNLRVRAAKIINIVSGKAG